ncbi:unnamed protein product, partial [Prorocentrum cordatum]
VAAAPPRPAGAPAPAAPAAGARAPPTGAPAAAEASPRAGAPGEAAGVHGRRRPGRPPGLARGAAARAAASAEARAGSAPDGTSPCASGAAPSPRPVLAGRAGLAAEAGGGPELAGPLGGASCSASAVGTAQGGADGKRRRLGPEPQAQAPAQACGSLAAGAAEALQLPQRSAAAEELLRGWQTASSGSWAPFPPSGGWADLEPSWAAQVLGRDPPCLTLRSRALEDAQNDTAGKMHMGTMLRGADWMADGFEFGTHKLLSTAELAEDIMDAGGCAKVKTSRLHSLFQDLLHKVRYPPAAMECSWQLRRLEYETGRRLQATPEDLLGDLPERPFRLLDNSNDALATQPPRFGDHPLRAEQLRSLAWMLRREGCGGVRPEPFVVEWRRFWSPGTASLGLEEEFDTEQVTPGASVRLRRDAAGPVVDCETQQAISAWPDGEGKCVRREGLTAVVDFSDAQAMLPRSTTLTCQVQDLEFCDHGSLEVGCLVQIVPGTKAPSFGWGGVKPTSVGVLLRQDGDILTVHFATHPAWRGRRDELQRADAGIQGELWTLDLRVRASYDVLGGILADKIGYGKTATCIALIDATLEAPPPPLPEAETGSFIPARGTLVVVPSNLFEQWLQEISKFVWGGRNIRDRLQRGWSPPGCPWRIFAITKVSPLTRVAAGELAEADVVLCSYRLLFAEEGPELCARAAGAPPDALGRAAAPSLADLVAATGRLLAGGGEMPSGRRGAGSVGRWQ